MIVLETIKGLQYGHTLCGSVSFKEKLLNLLIWHVSFN